MNYNFIQVYAYAHPCTHTTQVYHILFFEDIARHYMTVEQCSTPLLMICSGIILRKYLNVLGIIIIHERGIPFLTIQ